MKYICYDAYFGKSYEISEKEYKRKINSKHVLRVWDSYYQEFTGTYYDCRDSITRIFYWSREDASEKGSEDE